MSPASSAAMTLPFPIRPPPSDESFTAAEVAWFRSPLASTEAR